jgi:nucleotidyltransferase substrate binding protein (TIGR01987 family)
MTDARFALALEAYAKALARLRDVLRENETDIVRDALIQRFEFTFEAGVKACRRWLLARGASVAEEAFAVLPRAFANGLIEDEATWAEMRQRRNQTSHTYDEALAVEVAAFVRAAAVPAFEALLAALQRRADE